jgi:polar amino acid transport system substrate-binding protein
MRHRMLLVGLGLLAAFLAGPRAAAGDALDRIAQAGVVRIAVPDNFAPFGTLDSNGTPQGYDIDTARLIAEALGVKPDLVVVPSAERIPALTGGKVDLVVSTLGKDAEREKLIDFSTAYAPFFSGVYGPAPLAVAAPADLAGKTIAVTRDTIEDGTLSKLAPPTATIKRYDDNAGAEIAFFSNQTQLIATGNAVVGEVLAKSPVRHAVIKLLLRNSPCYVGVAKGEPALLARIDAIITAARGDGRLDAISQRWLKAPLGDPEHPDLPGAK